MFRRLLAWLRRVMAARRRVDHAIRALLAPEPERTENSTPTPIVSPSALMAPEPLSSRVSEDVSVLRGEHRLLTYSWDPSDSKENDHAKNFFHRMRSQGLRIFLVDNRGWRTKRVTNFPDTPGKSMQVAVYGNLTQWDHIRGDENA